MSSPPFLHREGQKFECCGAKEWVQEVEKDVEKVDCGRKNRMLLL